MLSIVGLGSTGINANFHHYQINIMKDIDYPDKPRSLPCWFSPKDSYVASALLSDGFEFSGLLEDVETPDYLEVITGNWSLGSICSVNELVAICDGAVF
ncbi:hypothetical protein H6G06_26850, partial [Anabaena sphaerica FACHB-251]|nr:hypothetical protein [Anabaena sphaerica FACHB-251]